LLGQSSPATAHEEQNAKIAIHDFKCMEILHYLRERVRAAAIFEN
jgi:hypothetical protein